jgi:hypothetical protein
MPALGVSLPSGVVIIAGYINFTKRVQIAAVMKKILEQQGAEYALQPIDCVQVRTPHSRHASCAPLCVGWHTTTLAHVVDADPVQEWFVSQLEQHGSTSEDALFNMSLVAEPREG